MFQSYSWPLLHSIFWELEFSGDKKEENVFFPIPFFFNVPGREGEKKINNNLTACISFILPILRPFLSYNIIGLGVEWKFIIHKFAGKQCHGRVWFGALFSLCSWWNIITFSSSTARSLCKIKQSHYCIASPYLKQFKEVIAPSQPTFSSVLPG